jgi:hypothetical protein
MTVGRALRVLAVLAVVLVVAVGAVVGWNRRYRTAGPKNPGFGCAPVIPARDRVPFAGGDVRRVALIGDSIMSQAECAIAESLAGVGIRTTRHGIPGTGLLAGLDWIPLAREILREEHPDAVIAIFVGNYLPGPVRDSNGEIIADNSPKFFRTWQARARQLSDLVRDSGADLYWVSPPPLADPLLGHAQRLFDGYRKIPDDHVLTSGRVLAGRDGALVMRKETCGKETVIRTPDRVHLTFDGARIYGQQIAHDFTAGLGVFTTPKPC